MKSLDRLIEVVEKLAQASNQLNQAENFLGRIHPKGHHSLEVFEAVRDEFRKRKARYADAARRWLEELEEELLHSGDDQTGQTGQTSQGQGDRAELPARDKAAQE